LAAEIVRDHRGLAGNGGDHGDADPTTLQRRDQGAEIAVAREQHDLVDAAGELHGIDRELDVHIALDLAPAKGIDEFLGGLSDDGIAVVVQPVDQRTDRRVLLILDDRSVVEGAQQRAVTLEFAEKSLVVNIEA
jgi:hypothetical protein